MEILVTEEIGIVEFQREDDADKGSEHRPEESPQEPAPDHLFVNKIVAVIHCGITSTGFLDG
jgi:hypothetical protein